MFKIFKNLFSKNIPQANSQTALDNTISDEKKQLAEEYYKLGNEYFDKDDFDNAIVKYTKAIQLNPYLSNYYNDRGLAYYYKEKDEEAKKDLLKAIELDEVNYCSYYNLGRLYRDGFKDYNAAIKFFNTAIKLKANNPSYYYELAETYFSNKNVEKAIENYLKVLEIDNEFEKKDKITLKKCFLQMLLARKEFSINSLAIAHNVVDEITSYINEHQDDSRGYAIRGNANHLLIQNEEAIEDLLKCIELDEENVNESSYWYLAHCYYRENQYKDAISYFNKLIDINKEDPRYFLFRGMSYYYIEKPDSALLDLNKTIEIIPDDGLAYLYLGFISDDNDEYDIAIERYLKAIEYDIGNMEYLAHYQLGKIYFKQKKDYKKSLEELSKVIGLDEKNDKAYWLRGCVYCDGLNQYDLAVCDFDKAIEINPDGNFYYSFAGYAYVHKGMKQQEDNLQLALKDYEKAIEFYQKACESETNQPINYDSTVGHAISLRNELLNLIDKSNGKLFSDSKILKDDGILTIKELDYSITKEQKFKLANLEKDIYIEFINEVDDENDVKQLLYEYAKEPTIELLEDIELEFPPFVNKKVAIAKDNQKLCFEHSNYNIALCKILFPEINNLKEKGKLIFSIQINLDGEHSFKIIEKSDNDNLNIAIKKFFNSIHINVIPPFLYEDKILILRYDSDATDGNIGALLQ